MRKSLLTSLCQREDFPLSGKEGREEILKYFFNYEKLIAQR
jgi:hypothetical protein